MAEHDLVERLRENAEMMRNGYQRNLTQLWHSEVVTNAAKDADEAADEIDRLRAALEYAASDCYLDDVDGFQPTAVALKARAALSLSGADGNAGDQRS